MARPAPWAAAVSMLAALAATIAFAVTQPANPASAAAVRIMPLGDSITGSPGCWRALLWNRLQSSGYTNIDFVGTLPPQGCSVSHDGDNEGHGGFLATNVANQNQLPGWLASTRPDIVVMHFGTNDVWSNISPATILTAFGKLVDQMRVSNPAMKILVAKIIPMNPQSCAPCGQRVVDFNAAIPGWAASKTTAQSPITVVDQWAGFSTAADTYDGVHPNSSGDQKIADRWFVPLASAISGVTPSPSGSPTASPSASPSPSPSTARKCSATYRIVNQWQGGFQGEVTVTNSGSVALTGWTVTFSFPNGQTITQLWNAAYAQSGAVVTARNLGWNGNLSPSTSAAFGFLANWSGSNGVPANTTCTPA
ncbi:MAG TPA: cellulose-binding protein [Micromonosporaceae bacterium]|nr:cellulose-binding protein [Micromonosporaceae bacterium]